MRTKCRESVLVKDRDVPGRCFGSVHKGRASWSTKERGFLPRPPPWLRKLTVNGVKAKIADEVSSLSKSRCIVISRERVLEDGE